MLGAVARGDDREAAKAFMTYWLGRTRWWLSPERFKTAIAATIPKVALEFTIAIDAETTLAGLCRDHRADAADRRQQDARARPAPSSIFWRRRYPTPKLTVLKGAGHMSPFTHPAELNRMILDHLAA